MRLVRWADLVVGLLGLVWLLFHATLFLNWAYLLREPLPLHVPMWAYFLAPAATVVLGVALLLRFKSLSRAAVIVRGVVLGLLVLGSVAFWTEPMVRASYDGPRRLQAWAVQFLQEPNQDGLVSASRLPKLVRDLYPSYVTIESDQSGRCVSLDWGGGFLAPHGLLVGPPGWKPGDFESRRVRRLADGVYEYESAEE